MKRKMNSQKFPGFLLFFASLIASFPAMLPAKWRTFDFSVMTWNIARLSMFVPDYRDNQANAIKFAHKDPLLNLGTVGIQEDFGDHLYNRLLTEYKYHIQPSSETGPKMGNGLSVFSDFPLTNVQKVKWEVCNGRIGAWNDCSADKGFVFSIIEIPIQLPSGIIEVYPIHFYSLHLDAGDSEDIIFGSDSLARENQLHQLHSFMNVNSSGKTVIVMGDFNIDHFCPYIRDLNTLTWFMSAQELTMANDGKHPINDATCGGAKYDFILFRSGDDPSIKLEKDLSIVTNNDQLGYKVLNYSPFGGSDHWPVWVRFRFSVNSEIKVISPNGGESWARGSTHNINWTSIHVDRVKIRLMTKTGIIYSTIAPSEESSNGSGSFSWVIPATQPTGDYKIEIFDLDDATITDSSDANFTIGSFPDKPVLKTPGENATVLTTTPTFTWYAVAATPAVDYYQLQINYNGSKYYASGQITGTSYSLPVANKLNYKTTYKWYVRAHNATGWSNWSTGRTLNTCISPPVLPSGCGTIKAGYGLGIGQKFYSCDGRFRLALQNDGNLVLYLQGVKAL